jgi:hypothetical protein
MQCSEMASVFELEGLEGLSAEAQEHVAQCRACANYVTDVKTILSVAHQIPAEVEPPDRVWISIRAELEREHIIRVTPEQVESQSWWHAFSELFRNRAMATAAIGVVIAFAVVLQLEKPKIKVLEARDDSFSPVIHVLQEQENDLSNMHLAGTASSAVDASLRQNLQQVDEFIADCERRLQQEPQDELAREYLTNAYQQKAQLLSAIMDGGSLN